MTFSPPPTSNPRVPSRQPFYGDVYAPDFWVRNRGLVGQATPNTTERLKMEHGRYLSGFGASPDGIGGGPDGLGAVNYGGSVGADPNYPDHNLDTLETQDDVYGSGIFSGPGTDEGRATANADMGVFASNYALPGYVGREVPYAVSRDISDITDGADVVMIPGGGMQYVERGGHIVPPPVLGPTPRPPALQTRRPPTGRDQVYVSLTAGGRRPQAPLNAGAPVRPAPTYQPARTYGQHVDRVPAATPQRVMPMSHPERIMPRTSIVSVGAVDEETGKMFALGAAIGIAAGAAWIGYGRMKKKKKGRR